MEQYDRDYVFGFLRVNCKHDPDRHHRSIVLQERHLDIIPYLKRTIGLEKYELEKHKNQSRIVLHEFTLHPLDDSLRRFIDGEEFGTNLLGYDSFWPFFCGLCEGKATVSTVTKKQAPELNLALTDDRLLHDVCRQLFIRGISGFTRSFGATNMKTQGRVRGGWTSSSFAAIRDGLYKDHKSPLSFLKDKMDKALASWSYFSKLHKTCSRCHNSFIPTNALPDKKICADCQCIVWSKELPGTALKNDVITLLGISS